MNIWELYQLFCLTAEEVIDDLNTDGVTLINGEPITIQMYSEAVQQISGTHNRITRHIITADRKHAARLHIYPSGAIDIEEIIKVS